MNIQSISSSLPAQSSPEAGSVSREVKLAVAAQEKAPVAKEASPEQLKAAIKSVREYIEPTKSDLEFSVIEETDQVVVKIIDSSTKEVIRQMPSEEMIAIAKALDSIKGLLLKESA